MKWTSRQRRESRRTEAGQHAMKAALRRFSNDVLPRQPRFYVAAATAAAFLVGSIALINREMNATQAWQQVFTDGAYVGLVPNQGRILSGMQRTAAGYDIHVQFSPIHTIVGADYDWQPVVQIPTKSYAIDLNGQPIAYMDSAQAAQTVLARVKEVLTPKNISAHADVQFTGDVSIGPAITGVSDILTTDAAVSYLLNPMSSVLPSRGTTVLAGNQSMFHSVSLEAQAADRTQSDVATSSSHPLLQVVVSDKVTQTVTLPYPVHYVKNGHMGKGATKVLKPGRDGKAKERIAMTYIDGQLASRSIDAEAVLSKPITQVEELGTNSGIATGPWEAPVFNYVITSPFGPRYLFGRYEFHPGVDLACPEGTPVYASNDGVVEDAGWNSGGYGIWVKINNGNGIETVFGHNSRVVVHAGETVYKGQLIAYSGMTGEATGPHVHYEVRRNGTAINPRPYM